MTTRILIACLALTCVGVVAEVHAKGEAQQRWELMNQIRQEKFDLVLPEVMRENGVDMWITVNREGFDDPLTEDFGKGYVGGYGYYIFTDRGDGRIERAVLGVDTALVEDNGAYDIFGGPDELKAFVEERDPRTIALNYALNIGAADGLRVLLSVVLIAPLAFFMGMPFPLGLRRVAEQAPDFVPWAWGINGFASVVSAVLATLLAI